MLFYIIGFIFLFISVFVVGAIISDTVKSAMERKERYDKYSFFKSFIETCDHVVIIGLIVCVCIGTFFSYLGYSFNESIETRESIERSRLERQQYKADKFESDIKEAIEKDEDTAINDSVVLTGMDKSEVREAWGEPDRIKTTTSIDQYDEQWCYPNFKYVYFRNGSVITIQE